jgi:DNA-binding NarL/FixJ family response regulator
VGFALDADAALRALPAARPDVILLDSTGSEPAHDITGELRAAAGGTARIVLYTGYPEHLARERMAGKVDGYVQKTADDAALVQAILALRRPG